MTCSSKSSDASVIYSVYNIVVLNPPKSSEFLYHVTLFSAEQPQTHCEVRPPNHERRLANRQQPAASPAVHLAPPNSSSIRRPEPLSSRHALLPRRPGEPSRFRPAVLPTIRRQRSQNLCRRSPRPKASSRPLRRRRHLRQCPGAYILGFRWWWMTISRRGRQAADTQRKKTHPLTSFFLVSSILPPQRPAA